MGHYWREMDPIGAEEHDRKMRRGSKLRNKLKNMSLGSFTVNELEAIMRLFGLLNNFEPHEEHLALLEKKIVRKKKRRTRG